MNKYVFIVLSNYGTPQEPRFVTDDYHELIVFVRRNSLDVNPIYVSIMGEWYADSKDISKSVYANAYNGFEHYKDRNYEVNF